MEMHNNGPQVLNPVQEQQQQALSSSSSSSSPSHEFSFTISLQSSKIPENLTPAGDIFFHGHLLPLHLLSHLPVSPRSSTNSLDSFTLPIKDMLPQNNPKTEDHHQGTDQAPKARVKAKSFSLFGKSSKVKNDDDDQERQRKGGAKFDVVRFIKNYMRLMRPSFVNSFRSGGGGKKGKNKGFQSSLSGNLLVKGKKEPLRGRRGGLSAPVTTRNSPTNSGHLVASESSFSSGPVVKSDSDMEELQAAISAAIAHCKKSIAAATTTQEDINMS